MANEITSRYTTILKNADIEFDKGNYLQAKRIYTEASALRPKASYPKETVWRDINPSNPGDNVYFELEPTEDVPPGDQSPTEVLGVWTSHIALLFGRPMKNADVQSIYPRAEQEGANR